MQQRVPPARFSLRMFGPMTAVPRLAAGPPPSEGKPPPGTSIIARDLQSVTFYNSDGEFAGVRRTDSGTPLSVNGLELVVEGMVGSTGLELKVDPGVPYVYAGFGGMMITTLLSYISHSQVRTLLSPAHHCCCLSNAL